MDQLEKMLGERVTVTVDRPIGYCHKGITYPVNYGFIPGMLAGDGEEQDAYILGVDVPAETFTGTVIGVIRRHNDREDKLVVAPEGMLFHQGQIARMVHFQEQFFESHIQCLLRKSCGVIPWRKGAEDTEILVVFEQFSQCWSLPKGHMEAGETEAQTAARELKEETGLDGVIDPTSRVVTGYPIGGKCRKEVVYFTGQVRGEVTARPGEIEKARWIKASQLYEYLHQDTAAAIEAAIKSL